MNNSGFHFETHIVFNNKDRVVHAGYITGGDIDIVDNWTGSIDGGTYINENGVPITFNEISNIYMMVEWQDTGKKESVSERIDLYNKSNKDQTFFN
ncbi:hypothetical protein ACOQFO_11730 [Ureibacillus sp. MALMAid1270]|uniref:hypothetical protein n=1 Tax=Ureibacillus sp. MALMAid1270 TaxID=3411629 RepID=UPI003BA7D60C